MRCGDVCGSLEGGRRPPRGDELDIFSVYSAQQRNVAPSRLLFLVGARRKSMAPNRAGLTNDCAAPMASQQFSSPFTVAPAAGFKQMPWKNGGGVTTELVIYPPGATMENFEWRVSSATVTGDGPFSVYSHVDRVLAVVTGAGLTLQLPAGRATVTLTATQASAFSFPGEFAIASQLVDRREPVSDLNVMTRRGVWRSFVTMVDAVAQTPHACRTLADVTLVWVPGSPAQVQVGEEQPPAVLSVGDLVQISGEYPVTVTLDTAARIYVIDLWRIVY